MFNHKRKREERMQNRLCVVCNSKLNDKNTSLCDKCVKRKIDRQKKEYEMRKAGHKCIYCGEQLPMKHKFLCCDDCRAKQRIYHNNKKQLKADLNEIVGDSKWIKKTMSKWGLDNLGDD